MLRTVRRLCTGLAIISMGLPAQRAAGQLWTPTLWVDLVQMPVAVARLNVAGLPLDLGLFVPALNVQSVSPTLFLSSMRGISILEGRDWDGSRVRSVNGPGMGGYVQALHARGLRGPALADAIHDELRDRGVPAGPKRAGAVGYSVLDRDFFPMVVLGRDDDDRRAGDGRGSSGARGGDGRGVGSSPGRGSGPAAAPGRGSGGGRGGGNVQRGQGSGGARGGGVDAQRGRGGGGRGGGGVAAPAASQGGRGQGGGAPAGKPATPNRGGRSASGGRG